VTSAPTVRLERVRDDELDAFFAMYEPYHLELDAYDPAPGGPEPFDLERYRAAVLDDMDGREIDWIVADGQRVGFCMVRVLADWADESRVVASIAEFYLEPDKRRQGIGRAAVEALLAAHRERGTHLVEAGILRDNEPAQAFWRSLGFEVQSVVTARRP